LSRPGCKIALAPEAKQIAPWSAWPTTNGARPSPQSWSPAKGRGRPKHIKFVTELPMTGVSKVDKKVLKAGFWAGRDRMVG
jgi:hypothetical protein